MFQMENQKAKSIIIEFADIIPKGEILDLGCGLGNNSLFLANKGFNITAVDNSNEKLAKLKSEAEKQSLLNKINIINSDIKDFIFNKHFSAIISTDVLHFLKKEEISTIIKEIKNHTINNGINIITVFTKNGDLKSDKMYFFENQELKAFYDYWEIIFYEERFKKTMEKDELGNPKKHEVASIVARKI